MARMQLVLKKYVHPDPYPDNHAAIFAMCSIGRIRIQSIKCQVLELVHTNLQTAKSGSRYCHGKQRGRCEGNVLVGNDVKPTVENTPFSWPNCFGRSFPHGLYFWHIHVTFSRLRTWMNASASVATCNTQTDSILQHFDSSQKRSVRFRGHSWWECYRSKNNT